MRASVVLSLLALLFTTCISLEEEKNDAFQLTGIITGPYTDWVYLVYGEVRDSARVNDGQFSFTGELDRPVQASLILEGTSNLTRVYLEGGDEVRITADYQLQGEEPNTVRTLQDAVITGSASQDLYTSMRSRYIEAYKADSTGQAVYELMAHLIDSTGSHPALGTQLASAAISSDVFTAAQLDSLYGRFDTTRMDAQAKEVYAIGMANRSRYGVGDAFPDIPVERPDGTSARLSELRGMQVYVDFWASWCAPCRQQHPHLKEIAGEVTGSSLAIVSISIDKNRDNWVQASEEDGVSWSSYWDADGFLKEDMAINAIPKSYLLDENGIIVQTNPQLEQYQRWASL
ncbi:TlpA disulfide reductase family protein [Lewinella sp. IMCC34191]|uniref:TlpA disulfide reductase family protein n=1 Tax=Lewinella sp. IMCC34191 TaxID=2259172 RepID=UPI0018E59CAB|nr:TlpA disulfide reductase family protein [Lewinella sp. IMCC34191]